jgi:hypothetical protein
MMKHMRDFSWKVFSMTGDLDAYMLYKQMANRQDSYEMVLDDEREAEADEDQYDSLNRI